METIVTRLNHAFATPALAQLASGCLECVTREFIPGGENGCTEKLRIVRFFEIDDSGFLKIRAGFVPRLTAHLTAVGIDIVVEDRTRWPILEQATNNLPDTNSGSDRGLSQAIVNSPRGRIVADARDHFRLVSLLCLVFAAACVLIVTANREQRDKLLARLTSDSNRPVSTHQDVAWGAFNRVTVITSHFFAGVSRVNNDFDVIVFLGAETVTGDNAYETACQLNNELVYCLVPPSYQPDELIQLRLEAICGPVIHSDVATAPTVQVVMLETPSMLAPGKLSPLERKRATIWHNDQRNDLIADIALAMGNGDIGTLSHRGGFLPEHVDLLTTIPNPGIAILVESAGHGRELLRRLPHWTLNTAIPDDDGALESGTCHRSIVTQAFASHGVFANILVRATGTASPLMVRGFPSMQQRGAIVLFDLADCFDVHAIRDTHERIADYRSRGWPVEAGNSWIAHQEVQENTKRKNGRGARA